MTQAELARKMGVSAATVYRWETGGISPRPQLVHAIKALADSTAEHESTPSDRDAIKARINELLDSLPESGRAEALAAIARIAEELEQRESAAGRKKKASKQGE